MTSTPDDRAPEPPAVPAPPAPDSASWGTPSSPVYSGNPAGAPPPPAPPAPPTDPWAVPADPGGSPYGSAPPGPPVPPPYGSAPPYGTSPYGAPVHAAPGQQPHGFAPPVPTDGLAVASLVTSVVGLVLLAGSTGPVGIGLGIGGLARIRRTGARGRGMAIAGIVVGVVGTAVLAAVVWRVVALAQWGSSQAQEARDTLGGGGLDQLLEEQLEGPGTQEHDTLPTYTLPQDVAVGTCWASVPEYYDLVDAVAVPCTQQHDAEVVALLTATGAPATDLTVEDPVLAAAYEQCDAAVAAIDPGLLGWGTADVWLPHPDQVAAGELVGYCVYEDELGTSGSLTSPTGVPS